MNWLYTFNYCVYTVLFIKGFIKTTKRWTRESVKKFSPRIIEKSFSSLCSIKTKANVRYISGCCTCQETDAGPQELVCPSCRKYVWHQNCLAKFFEMRKMEVPNFSDKNWACIHCALKKKFQKTIWLSNFYLEVN